MDPSLLWSVAVCLSVIYLVKWLIERRKRPPGPFGLPILGYLPFLSSMPHLDFQRLAKKYGNIFSVQMGSAYMVILNDFKSSKEAFAKDCFFGRPPESSFDQNKETMETGAFNGPAWKEQRRFSLTMLRDLGFGKTKMEEHIQEEINEMLELVEKEVNKPYCIYNVLAPSMSNNISSLLFGKRLKYNDPDRQMLTRVIKEAGSAAGQAAWQLFFPTIRKFLKLLKIGNASKISRIQDELKDYAWKEIERHEKNVDSVKQPDYIDGYLREIAKREKQDPAFCKPVLVDMVFNFFGAGSETVRLTVEWLILTVAQYPEKQRRIQSEIDEVIGPDNFPTWQDHKSMPYTQAFTMELIRWRTIIPLNLIRYALTDGEIGGYHIPKHTQIISNFWAIHHEAEYWGKDAEEFRPERFLTEDEKDVKKWEHYIPFSIGKRACPGEPLAKIEVFLYFTSILQRFNVRLPEGKVADFEGELGIGLMPKQQELIFTKRN